MPECECGEFVSEQWKRVFADNDGVVHACPDCAANASSKHPDKAGESLAGGMRL